MTIAVSKEEKDAAVKSIVPAVREETPKTSIMITLLKNERLADQMKFPDVVV